MGGGNGVALPFSGLPWPLAPTSSRNRQEPGEWATLWEGAISTCCPVSSVRPDDKAATFLLFPALLSFPARQEKAFLEVTRGDVWSQSLRIDSTQEKLGGKGWSTWPPLLQAKCSFGSLQEETVPFYRRKQEPGGIPGLRLSFVSVTQASLAPGQQPSQIFNWAVRRRDWTGPRAVPSLDLGSVCRAPGRSWHFTKDIFLPQILNLLSECMGCAAPTEGSACGVALLGGVSLSDTQWDLCFFLNPSLLLASPAKMRSQLCTYLGGTVAST